MLPFYPVTPEGSGLLATAFTLIALETIFFALRTASRFVGQAPFGADDVLVTAAFPILLAVNGLLISSVYQGAAGWHEKELVAMYGNEPLANYLKIQIPLFGVYFAGVTLPRLSILSLFLRIFIGKRVKLVCRALQVLLVVYPLAFYVAFFLICRPSYAVWVPEDERPNEAQCGDISALETYNSLPNIITDVIMLIIPIQQIWALRIPITNKVGVIVILVTGGMGLIVSCLRFAFWFRQQVLLTDITYNASTIGKFTSLETGGYFIAACVPVLKPFVDYITGSRPNTFPSTIRSRLSRSPRTGRPDVESAKSEADTSEYSARRNADPYDITGLVPPNGLSNDSSVTIKPNEVVVSAQPSTTQPASVKRTTNSMTEDEISGNIEVHHDFSVTRHDK